MRLQISRSKNSESFYVIRSVYEKGKRTTVVYEKLGTLQEVKEKAGSQDPYEWARAYVAELNRKEKESVDAKIYDRNDILKQERIKSLTAFINMEAFDPRAKIPDRIIDGFVERIIYDKGEFIWYLNPQVGNAIFEVDTTDWKKKMFKANKMVYPSLSGTGCYR